jgi:hypothetical protein
LGYPARGHGGNRLLNERDPHNFRFSILQRVSTDMDPGEIIQLENSWKERLHPYAPYGLNENDVRDSRQTYKELLVQHYWPYSTRKFSTLQRPWNANRGGVVMDDEIFPTSETEIEVVNMQLEVAGGLCPRIRICTLRKETDCKNGLDRNPP